MGWLIALFEFDYVCSDHIPFVKVFFLKNFIELVTIYAFAII